MADDDNEAKARGVDLISERLVPVVEAARTATMVVVHAAVPGSSR